MAQLVWDAVGEKIYETGIDHGVLYHADQTGAYNTGYVWNGLVSVTESPSGAEPQPQYADNIKYINITSAEEFGGTIEAFTYPEEFGLNDGSASPAAGVYVGQQSRKPFGFSYRTLVGNDLENTDYGYKLHLVWNAQANPSEKAYSTINDSPEATTFSWEFTTTGVGVGTVGGVDYKPVSSVTIDSTKVDSDDLQALETILYGSENEEPRMPTPTEVITMFATSP